MEEKILHFLKKEKRAYSIEELSNVFKIESVEEQKEFNDILRKMERRFMLHVNKKGNFIHFIHTHFRVGQLIVKPQGYGFLDTVDGTSIFIPPNAMGDAIDGDRVLVRIKDDKNLRTEGTVERFLGRDSNLIVGEFYYKKGKGTITPENPAIKINVEIDDKKTHGAANGHKVRVRLKGKPKNGVYKAEVERIIGHKDEPGIDILTVMYSYGIELEFPKKVISELENVPNKVDVSELSNRRDLRDLKTFTIDGKDAKDLDDAVSIKKLDNGNYLLGVHIADVCNYVKEGSELDKEAYNRATSVYLTDRVVPMLPQKLSNGICSLNPNVDRLTMTCEMEIDSSGNVINYDIYESVINSKNRMNYSDVNKLLEDNEVVEGYEDFVDELAQMYKLSKDIRNNKVKRGSLDFELDEPYVIVDKEGMAVDIKIRDRGEAQRLIEDFMVIANETVASHIFFMELPFIYRVHGEPSEDKITDFLKFISLMGYKVDGKIREITPKTMQSILDSLHNKKEFFIFSRLLLRSMQKAEYSPINIGHFGLGSKNYTHFTSPIRRYPDTTVHRLLKKYLVEAKYDKETIDKLSNTLPALAEHTSLKERDAINCEREVMDMKKAEYMEQHIGAEFIGTVTSVQSFGMFIELDNQVEGLVKLDELNIMSDSKHYFDGDTFSIRSNDNPRGFRLGDELEIIVKSANKKERKVEFELKQFKLEAKKKR